MTAPMSRPSLARIVAAAKAATKGPWFVIGPPWNPHSPWINAGSSDPHAHHPVCDFSICEDDETGEAARDLNVAEDAAYIAEMSPEKALALADALVCAVDALKVELSDYARHKDMRESRTLDALARVSALVELP